MNTAQRIIARHSQETHNKRMKLEVEAQALAVSIGAPNCYDRTYVFYDKSVIQKTTDGYKAE